VTRAFLPRTRERRTTASHYDACREPLSRRRRLLCSHVEGWLIARPRPLDGTVCGCAPAVSAPLSSLVPPFAGPISAHSCDFRNENHAVLPSGLRRLSVVGRRLGSEWLAWQSGDASHKAPLREDPVSGKENIYGRLWVSRRDGRLVCSDTEARFVWIMVHRGS
jgi:hypothetical protein